MKKIFEKNDLIKIALIALAVTIILTWIIPYTYYSSGEFSTDVLGRQGIMDIALANYYSWNFFLQQIIVLIFIGIFYGVLSKTSGYQALVNKMAKKFKKRTQVFAVMSSLFLVLLTTFLTQTFAVLIFVPLIISIAKKLKLDNITTFLITFGSVLIGAVGATYGTEGLTYFVNYLNYYKLVEIDLEILIRFGVLAVSFLILTFFIIMRIRKINNKKLASEETNDLFEVEKEETKKSKTWPMVIAFYLLLIFVVLGFVNWSANFNINVFNDFHEWLTGLSIGKYTVVKYILGSKATAFGSWDLYTVTAIMSIILIILSLIYRVKFDDFIDNAIEGIKKVVKPLIIYVIINMVFAIIYSTPFTVGISKWLYGLTESFNPFITTLSAAVCSIFNLDFGYTGYALGEYLTATYSSQFNIVYIIYITITGLMALITPTSGILMIGLSFLNIPYKKWLKNICKIFFILLALLLILFAVMTYL